MKTGDVVSCLVNIDPLKKGDQGTIESVDYNLPYPILVEFPSLKVSLYMQVLELKKIA